MRRVVTVISIASLYIVAHLITPLTAMPAHAQDDPAHMQCAAIHQRALVDYMANCFDKPTETVCGASGQVQIEMVSGQIIERGPADAGIAARLSGVAAVRTLAGDGSAWSLASLAVPDMLDAKKIRHAADPRPGRCDV